MEMGERKREGEKPKNRKKKSSRKGEGGRLLKRGEGKHCSHYRTKGRRSVGSRAWDTGVHEYYFPLWNPSMLEPEKSLLHP